MLHIVRTLAYATFFAATLAGAQQQAPQPGKHPTGASEAPSRDTSYIDAQGTAHITRVVPVPQDLSPEAQKFISRPVPDERPRSCLPCGAATWRCGSSLKSGME